ncbi:hypothetical protein AAG570_009070 [Ranatra chinensis]|uniref:Uncharacterized protein n=1 Tax=Ranatra chinensis TaxID=642074 RepID=A0ABD0YUV0_9HEMI
MIVKPTWTYGTEMWTRKSNIERIQYFQFKSLHKILEAPRYVSSYTFHTQLIIPIVRHFLQEIFKPFHLKLTQIPGYPPYSQSLNPPSRLKRRRSLLPPYIHQWVTSLNKLFSSL